MGISENDFFHAECSWARQIVMQEMTQLQPEKNDKTEWHVKGIRVVFYEHKMRLRAVANYSITMVIFPLFRSYFYAKSHLGSKLSTGERTNFIAAPQTKNDSILCFSSRKATSFTQDYVS